MRRGALRAGVWLCIGITCCAMSSAAGAPLPGPAPQRRIQPAEAANRSCEGCHAEIAAEWRQSFHRSAYTDRAFLRAEQLEPLPFCRACHAPEADPARPASGWATDAGVACVTCHLRGEQIVTGTAQRSGRAPHPVVHDPRLAGDGACVRCHEFGFPDGKMRTRAEFMQRTPTEHARSPFAARSCVSCHMPRTGNHRSHRFSGGHDETLLRRALRVTAARSGAQVRLLLTPVGVGHALPTGDLFRRLAVEVFCADSAGRVAWRMQRYLARHFAVEEQTPGAHVVVTRADDRVTGPTELLFTPPAGRCSGAPQFRITYERVLVPGGRPASAGASDGAVIDGAVLLASGRVR